MAEFTPEQLQEQLNAINAVIARGVSQVSYDGRSVTYYKPSEMREVRAEIVAQLEVAEAKKTGRAPKRRLHLAVHSRGYK